MLFRAMKARQTRKGPRSFLLPGRKEVGRLMEEHSVAQKLAAEFIGTALLVFIGAGSVPAMIRARRARARRSQAPSSA